MLRRGLALPLVFGLLATTGVASGTPCCTLTHLAGPAGVEFADCCDQPDCCRGEERGPVQANLSAKAPEAAPPVVLFAALPSLNGTGRTARIASSAPLVSSDLSPPLDRRATRLLISLFRI